MNQVRVTQFIFAKVWK